MNRLGFCSNMAAMWIIVPVKGFAEGKRRLTHVLAPRQRRALCRAMAEDVFATVSRVPGLAGVAVVTGDPEVATLATGYGFRLIDDVRPRGETAAVETAMARLASDGATACAVVPGDVPLATTAEIAAALEGHGAGPAVTLVPSRDGRGTNLVAMSPVAAIQLRFGDDSFPYHTAAARQLGVEPRILRLAGLGLDIDTGPDLQELISAGIGTRAWECLSAIDLDPVAVPAVEARP